MNHSKVVMGKRIREAREEKGITQKELGVELGYSPMGISHFENGIRELKVSDIQKMCTYFGKDMSYFLQHETTFFRASPDQDTAKVNNALKDFDAFLNKKGF